MDARFAAPYHRIVYPEELELESTGTRSLKRKSLPSRLESSGIQIQHPVTNDDSNVGTDSTVILPEYPQPLEKETSWRPGCVLRFPWLGFGAILSNLLCTVIAIVVLELSNNREIGNWKGYFQPSVWLSITSTIGNLSLSVALAQGAVVFFWRKAVKGATLEDLHRCYGESLSFVDAISGVYHVFARPRNLIVAFACILTTLSALRSPLMQRASTVTSIIDRSKGSMSVRVAQELNDYDNGFGIMTGRNHEITYLSKNFTNIVLGYTNKADIDIDATFCGDNCTTTIKAFGFNTSCTSWDAYYNSTVRSAGDIIDAFSVSVLWDMMPWGATDGNPSPQAPSTLGLNVSYLSSGLWVNATKYQHCDLVPATMEYPVRISAGTVSLSGTWKSDRMIKLVDKTQFQSLGPGSLLGGFNLYLGQQFASNVTADWGGAVNWIYGSTGLPSTTYVSFNSTDVSITDPLPDILDKIRELAFRSAIQTPHMNPKMANTTQVVQYTGQSTIAVYRSNFKIMAFAVILNLLGVMSILPLFWGWWQLERKTSFSPLEIANAFEAPLLREVHGNATQSQIRNRVGQKKVKYNEKCGMEEEVF